MNPRPFLTGLFAIASCCALGQDILAEGRPPLTGDLASKYTRFMGWVLGVPLTKAQESSIRSFLVQTWRSEDALEIDRVVTLVAMRDRIEAMKLQEDEAARSALYKRAVRTWSRNSGVPAASWAMPILTSATRPLIPGSPPLTKQMVNAYEELGLFMIEQAFGAKPTDIHGMQRVQLAESLSRAYPKLGTTETANFSQIPRIWVQIRRAWPRMTETDRMAHAKSWRERFERAAGKAAVNASKTLKAEEATLARLLNMNWVLRDDVFKPLETVGGSQSAYGTGW